MLKARRTYLSKPMAFWGRAKCDTEYDVDPSKRSSLAVAIADAQQERRVFANAVIMLVARDWHAILGGPAAVSFAPDIGIDNKRFDSAGRMAIEGLLVRLRSQGLAASPSRRA